MLHESFGLYLWPSSLLLAQLVWANRDEFAGKVVMELGAGVGLPGVTAAAVGARVTLTDRQELEHVHANCALACERNSVDANVVRCPRSCGTCCATPLTLSHSCCADGVDVGYVARRAASSRSGPLRTGCGCAV